MHSETNLVILDACRNNPLAGELARATGRDRAAAAKRGLARVEDDDSDTLIAYATAPGAVADDGTGNHSPYTMALLEHLETPGLSVNDLFMKVTNSVLVSTGGNQRPWTNTSLTKVVRLMPAVDTARLRWEAIAESDDPSVFRVFEAEFAESNFAALARKSGCGIVGLPTTIGLRVMVVPGSEAIAVGGSSAAALIISLPGCCVPPGVLGIPQKSATTSWVFALPGRLPLEPLPLYLGPTGSGPWPKIRVLR